MNENDSVKSPSKTVLDGIALLPCNASFKGWNQASIHDWYGRAQIPVLPDPKRDAIELLKPKKRDRLFSQGL